MFGMLFLLIVLSLHNIGSIRNIYAFDFKIPDIPFLNFNLDSRESSTNKDDLPDNERGDMSAPVSDNYKEMEYSDLFSEADSDTLSSEKNSGNKLYDSLPFPSNTINNLISDQTHKKAEDKAIYDEHELNQISSYIPNTLPLISDYSDFPSTFVLDSNTEVGKEIPNQYIVIFKDDYSGLSDFFSAISEKADFRGVELLQVYENVLNGIAVKVPNEQVIESIEKLAMVDFVENDILAEAFAQTTSTGMDRIDADLRFINPLKGNENVDTDIAILDSGIDLTHPDLNVYHEKSFITSNTDISALFEMKLATTTTTITTNANDDNGHGTHVAGIAAAKDNSIGTVGVAPGAKLWAIKVLDNDGVGPLSTIIKGIDYITQYADQIEVANLNLGCECKSDAFDTAIDNAVKSGIVFVVAAGNAGKDAINTSPANNPNVISVSAVADSDGKCGEQGSNTVYGADDSLASFSNYGSAIDIAAPGAKIYSTYKDDAYATMSGTSMASSHVAGAAALYLAVHPHASPSTVKSVLLNQSTKFTYPCDGNGFGYFGADKDQIKEPLLYVKKY